MVNVVNVANVENVVNISIQCFKKDIPFGCTVYTGSYVNKISPRQRISGGVFFLASIEIGQ